MQIGRFWSSEWNATRLAEMPEDPHLRADAGLADALLHSPRVHRILIWVVALSVGLASIVWVAGRASVRHIFVGVGHFAACSLIAACALFVLGGGDHPFAWLSLVAGGLVEGLVLRSKRRLATAGKSTRSLVTASVVVVLFGIAYAILDLVPRYTVQVTRNSWFPYEPRIDTPLKFTLEGIKQD
jgi:hypothetical protein